MDRLAPFPPPMTGPPSWLPLVAAEEAPEQEEGNGAPGPNRESPIPGEGWPHIDTIDYLSKLIVLILLLMALPWLIDRLLSHPGELPRHSAHLVGAPGSAGA